MLFEQVYEQFQNLPKTVVLNKTELQSNREVEMLQQYAEFGRVPGHHDKLVTAF